MTGGLFLEADSASCWWSQRFNYPPLCGYYKDSPITSDPVAAVHSSTPHSPPSLKHDFSFNWSLMVNPPPKHTPSVWFIPRTSVSRHHLHSLLRRLRAEAIAPLASLAVRLSGLLPCPLVCLWFSQHGAVCAQVWEPALQHTAIHTPGLFYKSAISFTLGKHSSALPKADGPIDLNYWPAPGSYSLPLSNF